jgi:hypothetical protein
MPDAPGVKVVTVAPSVGCVAKVTADSDQAEPTVESVTAPGVLIRLTKRVSEALEICAAVVPAGSDERSYCRKAVLPLPT